MTRKFHPYAFLIGLAIGVVVFISLRHPLFAVFASVISMALLNYGFNRPRVDTSKAPKKFDDDLDKDG